VRILFVGESPPASGRFFYRRDSGLYRAIRDAFREIDPALSDESFLAAFRAAGCYLIDACPRPVDRLDRLERTAAVRASERDLGRTIRRLRPDAIVTVVRSTAATVERAASSAGWQGPMIVLPYPGRWSRHRARFLELLVPMLRGLAADSPLRSRSEVDRQASKRPPMRRRA
jgi:hypothetical protein